MTHAYEFTFFQDFFQGLEQLLRTTSATDIPTSSPYSKSSLKRATSDLRAKDLRKAIEVLYKRVDKHFGDVSISNPSAEHAVVIGTVWKAIEDEVVRLSEAWRGLIRGSYPVCFHLSIIFTQEIECYSWRKTDLFLVVCL